MRVADIQYVLRLLQDANITVCVVGELALNYYNVPRVIHVGLQLTPAYRQYLLTKVKDLELCVPLHDLRGAIAIMTSHTEFLQIAMESEYNIYTEYKRDYPRFRFNRNPGFHIVLFSDKGLHLDPLSDNTLCSEDHQHSSEYSREIFDLLSIDEVVKFPFPRFVPFFAGLCEMYVDAREVMAMIAAEALVDSMNLDEKWCRDRLQNINPEIVDIALGLVSGKHSRISDFSPNQVTCYVPDTEEALRVRRIPGFV